MKKIDVTATLTFFSDYGTTKLIGLTIWT